MLSDSFFDQDACTLAQALLGKVICVKYQWLSSQIDLTVRIIETEAYYLNDKASHASLGYTEKRKALFMPAGTIYMYHARGKPSLNISAHNPGNAVLIKSGYPYIDQNTHPQMIRIMQHCNPPPNSHQKVRSIDKLCCGQTLLCQSLGLTVTAWDQQRFDIKKFFIKDVGYQPKTIIQTTRLGIPIGRDEHLLYRFLDSDYASYTTAPRAHYKHYKIVVNPSYLNKTIG